MQQGSFACLQADRRLVTPLMSFPIFCSSIGQTAHPSLCIHPPLPLLAPQVYKTPSKGWAVRSWDRIPAGSVVCEFTGEVHRDDEGFQEEEDTYLISLDPVDSARRRVRE